jgi:hypothetical protein
MMKNTAKSVLNRRQHMEIITSILNLFTFLKISVLFFSSLIFLNILVLFWFIWRHAALTVTKNESSVIDLTSSEEGKGLFVIAAMFSKIPSA